jgi:hypothetical protein
VVITPFGVPVEPDVKRIFLVSVNEAVIKTEGFDIVSASRVGDQEGGVLLTGLPQRIAILARVGCIYRSRVELATRSSSTLSFGIRILLRHFGEKRESSVNIDIDEGCGLPGSNRRLLDTQSVNLH